MWLENSTVEEKEFTQWLSDVGHKKQTTADGSTYLKESMMYWNTVDNLIIQLYPGIRNLDTAEINNAYCGYFLECTILAAHNDDVDTMNHDILFKLPGQVQVILRCWWRCYIYPVEYLNSINLSEMLSSKLQLKVGAPVMILQNLDPTKGLCNGTWAILTHISSRVLEVKMLAGEHAGNTAIISQMTIASSTNNPPFVMKHRHFPIWLAFSMTINKSQG